ncbi:MAG: hypothetical protein RHS_0701 [Robinsoniella sp. RHS]|uniref:hypothetical protein n=1 Tax=Robinsoniella sp. RHS TaxID=1504536 RepID=UPI00064A1F19|nr:MAG: hypothetical protein RHS_0701 [Robinsoniella sp. RHS]
MKKKKNSRIDIRRILAYLLTVCICIGGIPIAYALGDEQSAENKTLLTYNDSGTEVDVFEPSEEFNEAWSLGVENAAEQLASEGYENLEAANEKDVMIYVSKEDKTNDVRYLKPNNNDLNNMEAFGLEKYDGKGGRYYIWKLCKGVKIDNTEADTEDLKDIKKELTEYFWIRTDLKVELIKSEVDDQTEEVIETGTETRESVNETVEVSEGTEQSTYKTETEAVESEIAETEAADQEEKSFPLVKNESSTLSKGSEFVVNRFKYNVYRDLGNGEKIYVDGSDSWSNTTAGKYGIVQILNYDRNGSYGNNISNINGGNPGYTATNNHDSGKYIIDLHNGDLSIAGDWSGQLNGANAIPAVQWGLTFCSTGSDGSGSTAFTLELGKNTRFGAHVTIHGDENDAFGCKLKTPTRASDTYGSVYDNNIQANGWSFIVEKDVEVTGNATVYGAVDGSYDGRTAKKFVNQDGLASTNVEIYSGTWFFIAGGAGRGHAYTETNVIVGSPSDTDSDYVTVEGAIVATGLANGDYIIYSEAVENSTVSGFNILVQGYTKTGVIAGTCANHFRGTNPEVHMPNMNILVKDHVKVIGDTVKYTYENGWIKDMGVVAGDMASDNAWYNVVAPYYKFHASLTIQDDVQVVQGVDMGSPNAWMMGNDGSTSTLTIKDRVIIGGNVFNGGWSDVVSMPYMKTVIQGAAPGENGVKINGSLYAFSGDNFQGAWHYEWGTTYVDLEFLMENAAIGGNLYGVTEMYDNDPRYINNLTMDVSNSIVNGSVFGVALDDMAGTIQENLFVNISDSTVGGAFLFGMTGIDENASGNTNRISGENNQLSIKNSIVTSNIVGTGMNTYKPNHIYGKNAKDGMTTTYNVEDGTFNSVEPYDIPETKLSIGVYESSTISAANSYTSPYGKGNGQNIIDISGVTFTGNSTAKGIAIGGIGSSVYNAEGGNSITVNISNIKNRSEQPMDIIGCSKITGDTTATAIPKLTLNLNNISEDVNLNRIMFSAGGTTYLKSDKEINLEDVTVNYIVAHGNDDKNSTYNKTVQNAAGKTAVLNLTTGNIIGSGGNIESGIEAANLNVNIKGTADDKASGRDLFNVINGKFIISGSNYTNGAGILQMEGGDLRLGHTGASGEVADRLAGSIVNTSDESRLYIYKSEGTDHNNTYPLSIAANGSMKSTKKLKLGEWNEKKVQNVLGDKLLNFRTQSKADETQYDNALVYPHKIGKDSIGNIVLGERVGYQVSYNFNGGTGGIPLTETYEEGATATVGESADMIPPADKVFDYWESSAAVTVNGTSTTKLNPKDTFIMPAQDITLKAIWKDAKTDIKFDGFEDGNDALLKIKNEAGKVNSKALPKIKINGEDASLEDLEKMTYTYERYTRTGSSGNYTYDWSGKVLQEGINDADIEKLPISITKPGADNLTISANTKKTMSGIVKLTISYNGDENSQASCIIISSGDVDLNGNIRASDIVMLEAYISGDPGVKLDQYAYQKIMGDMNSEATTGTIRITPQDVELLEAIIVN